MKPPSKHQVHRANVKAKAIAMMGGRCQCGVDDPRVLRFHHEPGVRSELQKLNSTAIHRAILKGSVKGVKLLCSNCSLVRHVDASAD